MKMPKKKVRPKFASQPGRRTRGPGTAEDRAGSPPGGERRSQATVSPRAAASDMLSETQSTPATPRTGRRGSAGTSAAASRGRREGIHRRQRGRGRAEVALAPRGRHSKRSGDQATTQPARDQEEARHAAEGRLAARSSHQDSARTREPPRLIVRRNTGHRLRTLSRRGNVSEPGDQRQHLRNQSRRPVSPLHPAGSDSYRGDRARPTARCEQERTTPIMKHQAIAKQVAEACRRSPARWAYMNA